MSTGEDIARIVSSARDALRTETPGDPLAALTDASREVSLTPTRAQRTIVVLASMFVAAADALEAQAAITADEFIDELLLDAIDKGEPA